ncbi:MAG TPA: sugar phosphate isomerase/epimerase family protein [Candidatus Anammoximicrobium sp.]|nr:sugar phosphate isomerase/epimerase family protein [Candidatus Anammoximicrobium sp.]
MNSITRRQLLTRSVSGLGAVAVSPLLAAVAQAKDQSAPFKIGACDWSIGKTQKPEAFAVAKEIGLDGVEVSFSQPGSANDLRDAAVRAKYQEACQATGLEICSLAMGMLNSIPYASDPRTEQWVADVVEVMPKLGVKGCLLAFFGNGDIKGDRAKQDEVIRRLKKIAPQAEKAGVVLGIESWLNADDHLRILDGVGSPAIQVYYDVCNMTDQGYDICQEIRQLGKNRICQIHIKENGSLIGQGKVNLRPVRDAIADIGYRGWLVIEGATIRGKTLVECYQHNQKHLRTLFGAG